MGGWVEALWSGRMVCTEWRLQITRVLIERLIVNKPHPWGLLITFIELIKNPTYDIWRHDFVRSCTEIEQLYALPLPLCPANMKRLCGVGAQGPGLCDSCLALVSALLKVSCP